MRGSRARSGLDALPWVLLSIRAAPKEDLASSSAELVYGFPLTVPGDFISSGARTPGATLQHPCEKVGALSCPDVSPWGDLSPRPHVPSALQDCPYVSLCRDALRTPLQRPDEGLFRVLQTGPTTFVLDLGVRSETVSVARLKPAHLDISQPVQVAQTHCWGVLNPGRSRQVTVNTGITQKARGPRLMFHVDKLPVETPSLFTEGTLAGNLVWIIVLGRGKCGLSRGITHYLVAMAAADLLFVFFKVAIYYLYDAIFRGATPTVACTLHRVMAYVSLDCSVWLTVAFTFDRFVAICCQDFKTRYCTVRIARVATATVYVVSLLRNIPYYFAFYSYYIDLPIQCIEKPEYYSHPGWLAFSWIHTILTPLVPFFVILTLNILTVRSIVVASRARRKLRANAGGEKQEDPEMQSRRKSIILLFCVNGSFILLWLTDVCFLIYKHITNLHTVQKYANPRFFVGLAADLLTVLSSCTNTFIYVLTQSKFRDELKNAIKYPYIICLRLVRK
ncbi:putative G-protein coupled receptor 139 [Rhinoraja longicauda]